MIQRFILLCASVFLFLNCQAQETPKVFSEKALNDTFITLDGNEVSFQSILEKHRGKTVFLEVWASWCSDCIKGMPKVKELKKEHGDIDFVFLSLDKSQDSWKKGIEKYQVEGEHYFMQSGWKGDFGTFLNLDWIPRYMVVDKTGNIKIYKAVKADDTKLKSAL